MKIIKNFFYRESHIYFTNHRNWYLCYDSWYLKKIWPWYCILNIFASLQTQNICITFVQRRPNVFECYTSVLYLVVLHLYNVAPTSSTLVQHCTNVILMFCVYWDVMWSEWDTSHINQRKVYDLVWSPTPRDRKPLEKRDHAHLWPHEAGCDGYPSLAKAGRGGTAVQVDRR